MSFRNLSHCKVRVYRQPRLGNNALPLVKKPSENVKSVKMWLHSLLWLMKVCTPSPSPLETPLPLPFSGDGVCEQVIIDGIQQTQTLERSAHNKEAVDKEGQEDAGRSFLGQEDNYTAWPKYSRMVE